MPGVPLTCFSIAVVVVCSTVCASAPVKLPAMETVGGDMSGYWATGRLTSEISPTSTITTDITIAVTGLFIKVSAIISINNVPNDREVNNEPGQHYPVFTVSKLFFWL